jgi:hypothetical protein
LSGEEILGKEIVIHDLMGRQVYRGIIDKESYILSTDSWKSGIYNVMLFDSNGVHYEGKIVRI